MVNGTPAAGWLPLGAGMTVAALAAGCPAILKPAEQSPLVAYEFVRLLHEAGLEVTEVADYTGSPEILGGRGRRDGPLQRVATPGVLRGVRLLDLRRPVECPELARRGLVQPVRVRRQWSE